MTPVTINGRAHNVDLPDDTPLLWALRDQLGLTGTKFGCGMALCGACTVHVDGQPVRSCITPLAAVANRKVTTIEAVGADKVGQAVQAAWVDLGVPQCGYCQAGQIMSADGAAQANPEAHRRRHRRGDERQHLPLRHVHADPRRHQAGRGQREVRDEPRAIGCRAPSPTRRPSAARHRQRQPAPRSSRASTALGGLVLAGGLPVGGAPPDPPKYGADGMPNGWVDNPLVFVSIAEDGTVVDRLPSLRDGAGRAHRHAHDRGRRARGGLEARARRAGDRATRSATATRTRTARAARATSSSRCAAAARRRATMLEAAAAARWKVPVGEVEAKNHEVVHRPTGRRARLRRARQGRGRPARAGARDAAPQGSVAVPLHRQGRAQAGRRPRHRDGQGAVRHRHAPATACSTRWWRVRRCYGGKVASFDAAAALKVPGVVRVVQIEASRRAGRVQSAGRRRRRSRRTPGPPSRAATRSRSRGTTARTRATTPRPTRRRWRRPRASPARSCATTATSTRPWRAPPSA